MKKFGISICLAAAFGFFAFAGCDITGSQDDGGEDIGGELPPAVETLPEEPEQENGKQDNGSEGELPKKEKPSVSPLSVLDTVDVSAAFGDRSVEGWSFALKADGDLSASYGFRLMSEITDEEKLNFECSLGLGLEDLFGVRSNENNALGFDLFGEGKVSLFFNDRGPSADSEPLNKSFDIGFRHDGDFIWYAGEGEDAAKISLPELKEQIETMATVATFKRMEDAFAVIPDELDKGVSLRLAVEKLIDLGFTVEIDDSDGVAVTLKAGAGFYTDLLNDMLETFIPTKWLEYLPRADFGYEKTVFNIKLAFDGNGIFKEYSMSSDVTLTASLEVRNVFYSESAIKTVGGLSFTAYSGELSNAVATEESFIQ